MSADLPLDGRVAVVTGGGGGIGRASAAELAAQGARVVVADVAEDAARGAADEIMARGGQAISAHTDVTSPEQLQTLMERTLEAFGGLDVMFNNAGVADGGPLLQWSPERYRRVIAVNQDGVFYGIQAAARAMQQTGRGGVIINTGSVYGRLASLYSIGYQASKAAVEVMTRVAALELAPDRIRVVNVAPGIVDTPMVDAYREAGIIDAMAKKQMRGALVQPRDVASVVAFLASDAAACINGTTVYADDGYSAFK
jgi:NAD(P)-dependent dehydrogenase (short-subunit alcohol dehydrogenase family)